jgi:hypothetical protein
MTAINDITKAPIKTKPASQAYRDNYDLIFKKKLRKEVDGSVSETKDRSKQEAVQEKV